jgi:hypothetical protein
MSRRISLLCALLLLAPASASAWNSITTDTGNAITWDPGNPETTWHLSNTYTCDDLTNTQVDSTLNLAMNEWAVPGCTSFNAVQGADRSGNPVDSNQNEDLVGFTGGWPPAWGDTTLAVTVPVFYNSGEILQASLTFNELNYEWITTSPNYWDEADLQSIAAHEFGHWIGFDHSTFTGSSLNAYYSGGTSERTLTCDDTEGVCDQYSSSGNDCTHDRYCECGVGCNGGYCGGTPTDDDDAVDDDDDTPMGECSGSAEGLTESEPNDWDNDEDVDYAQPGGGDLTISGSLTCGHNDDGYTGDYDWFVVDFPCVDDARFVLDWNGSNSDLDFYVWVSSGEQLTGAFSEGTSAPEYAEEYAGGRLFFLVVCWEGNNTSYEFKVDWAPWQPLPGDDDDDDDDVQPDDDDVEPDDDDQVDDDDEADDDDQSDDDDDGGGRPVRRTCACDEVGTADAVGLFALLGLFGLAASRRRLR